MFYTLLCLSLTYLQCIVAKKHSLTVQGEEERRDDPFELIKTLRNDANLDLSVDEEYEDLRAELLAYHTALASFSGSGRRSLGSTPCWTLGGICINVNLCAGDRYLTQVPGCKSKLQVCCFSWNKYKIRDMRDKGIDIIRLPWKLGIQYGGKGIVDKKVKKEKKLKRKKIKLENSKENQTKLLAFVIRT